MLPHMVVKQSQGDFSLPWQYVLGHLKDVKDNDTYVKACLGAALWPAMLEGRKNIKSSLQLKMWLAQKLMPKSSTES